jgi:hypothetical protein
MSKHLQPTDHASLETTTRNMADAVSYLTRVAMDAGLKKTAMRLASLRVSLLRMSQRHQREAETIGMERTTVNGDSHGKRALN